MKNTFLLLTLVSGLALASGERTILADHNFVNLSVDSPSVRFEIAYPDNGVCGFAVVPSNPGEFPRAMAAQGLKVTEGPSESDIRSLPAMFPDELESQQNLDYALTHSYPPTPYTYVTIETRSGETLKFFFKRLGVQKFLVENTAIVWPIHCH